MSARSEESAVERLRKQAERAIAAAHGRRTVEPLLERIVSLAPDGSEASVFAHRHLAEYRIEDHPWRALLHLRKVVVAHPDDDVIHALMGLSHALLANFRAAVSAYRRAIAIAQRNPWYHHNLGHLLDVALDQPGAALRHLELAHRAAHPPEHEIAASLAHCLARLGRIDDARQLASAAVSAEPRNREHKQLLAWIERGAPEEGGDPRTRRAPGEPRGASRRQSTAGSKSTASDAVAHAPAPRDLAPRSAGSRPAGPGAVSPRPVSPRAVSPVAPSAVSRAAVSRSPAAVSRGVVSASSESSSSADDVARRTEPRGERRAAPTRERPRTGANVRAEPGVRARDGAPRDGAPRDGDAVVPLLDRVMREGGFTPEHIARARRLWVDYRDTRSREERATRAPKPEVCAAAIEYAIARLHGLDGVTRASVARRYGVSARSVCERFDDIQVVLALKPDDPRYARC